MEVGQSVLRWLELAIPSFLEGKIGWGGRIRTFTVLINSEVSYQLDHAPAGCLRPRLVQGRTVSGSSRRKKSAGCRSKIPRVRARRTRLSKIYNEQNKRYGPFRM